MSELQSVYQRTVLEHNRAPHNFRPMAQADRCATGHNPLCGDKLTVYLQLQGDIITDIAFEGHGCAISIASASIMTDLLASHSQNDARKTANDVVNTFTSDTASGDSLPGDLSALADVRRFPSRIKCATLAWKTLETALRNDSGTTTTE